MRADIRYGEDAVLFLNRTIGWAGRSVLTLCATTMMLCANVSAASTASSAQASSTVATPETITADDPVKLRDTLAGQTPGAAKQSITERLRSLAREPFDRIFHGSAAKAESGEHTFMFM